MDALLAQRTPTAASGVGAEYAVTWSPHDPVAWIQREFFIPENAHEPAPEGFDPKQIYDDKGRLIVDRRALQLEPYQAAVLNRALTRVGGNFPYSLVLWSDLKKSAKSTIAGAVDLWLAWHHPEESVRVVGNDLKQANSRTFFYTQRAIRLNPRLRDVIKSRNYRLELPNHTVIEAIAVDPKGEAGGGDLIVTFTELWAAKNLAAQQLWTETTLSPLKYGKSLRWVETYAGFEGESPILEQLYQAGVRDGTPVDVGVDGLELFENTNGRLLCLWNTVPRCYWQTADYYAQEAAVLTASEMARIHHNEWQQSSNPFVPIEWWDQCKVGALPDLRPLQPMVVSLDAAVSNDCFGIVAVTRTSAGIEVRHARKWQPANGQKLHYSDPAGDANNIEFPEGYLRWLVRTHHVAVVTYDEFQLHDFCTRLGNEHLAYFEAFGQGAPRLVADKQLYDIIKNGQIVHDGQVDLHDHIRNANRTDEDADKLRIVKRAPHLKIDLAVALSMACAIARTWNIG